MNLRLKTLAAVAIIPCVANVPARAADEAAAPAVPRQFTYAADAKPILDVACAKCHGGEKAKAGVHMDSLEGVLHAGKRRKLVEPGNSNGSQLIKIVESIAAAAKDPEGKTRALHKRGPKPLTAEQITLLKSWIDQGAK
jgi:hypothetical protein